MTMTKTEYKPLGQYITMVDERNRGYGIDNLVGVSFEKKIIPSIANTIGTDLSNYRIIKPRQFAYCPVTSRNGDRISIAMYEGEETAILSVAYTVFEVNESELLPEYLMLWVSRPEFDRYARFMSHGSVRELFSWEEMCNVTLPVPSIDEQRRLVNEYQTVERRIKNNEALIQKLEETAQAIYHHTFVEGIDENNLPDGWRKDNLEKVVSFKVGGDKPEVFSVIPSQECTIPIYSNGVEEKGLYGYTDKAAVHAPSVTISARGNVGTCFLRMHPYSGIVRLVSVIPNNKHMLYYLFYDLSSRNLQGDGSAQAQITVPQLQNEHILIPSDEVLETFFHQATIIYHNIECVEKELHHLRTLQSLLTLKLA